MKTSISDKLSLFLLSIIVLTVGFIFYANKTGQFEKHKSQVHGVDNNKYDIVVGASQNELFLWNKRKCTGKLVGHSDAIVSVAFSISGQQIASGSIDKSVKIWSTSSKKVITTLNGHSAGIAKVEFSKSDNYIMTAGYDDKMIIWDWKNNEIEKKFNIKHSHFSISNKDVLAYIDSSCFLKLFDLKSMSPVKVVGQYCGRLSFSPVNNIIAVNDINTSSFTFIDLSSNKVLTTLNIKKENTDSEVMSFKFTPDGKYIVASIRSGDIEIWDWQKNQFMRTLEARMFIPNDGTLAFNNKNQLITASGDLSLKFWEWNTGDLKMVVGDGLFQAKLNGLLSILVLLTLITGFWALTKSMKSKLTSYIVLFILTLWSLGIGIVLYFFKSKLTKYATPIIWTTTVISGIFFIFIWISWLALFTIPITFLFCYFKLITNGDKKKIYFPLLINLIFCGILCSFVLSSGLLR